MSTHAETIRHELDQVLEQPPEQALERLRQLEQDCQQLADAQGEGMQGAAVGSLFERIQAPRKRLKAKQED